MKEGSIPSYTIVPAFINHGPIIAMIDYNIFYGELSAEETLDQCMNLVFQGISYVARTDDDIILGYILCALDTKKRLTVASFAVVEQYRHHGIGTALMGKVIESILPIYGELYLMTNVDNTAATRIYQRYGFECVKVKKDFYRVNSWTKNRDAFKMIKYG